MTHPTKPLDIEAREVLSRQYGGGIADLIRSGAWDDRRGTKEALAAISELLTRLREVENTNHAYVVGQYKDALFQLSTSQALLKECKEVLKPFADAYKPVFINGKLEGHSIGPTHGRDYKAAASLIEKLEGQ